MSWTRFWLEEVGATAVSATGIVLNAVSLTVILSRRLKLRKTLRKLLITLLLFDSCFLLCIILIYGALRSWRDYHEVAYPQLVPWLHPLSRLFMCGSVWTVVAISLERFMTLCKGRPHQPFLCYLFPILALSVGFAIPGFFAFRYRREESDDDDGEDDKHILEPTELRTNPAYVTWYIGILNFLLNAVTPAVALAVLNACIVRAVLASRRRRRGAAGESLQLQDGGASSSFLRRLNREELVAVMLVAVVVIFAICHSLKFMLNFFEMMLTLEGAMHRWPSFARASSNVSTLLLALNSAVNPLIYYSFDHRFRECLADVLTCRIRRRRSREEEDDDDDEGTKNGRLLQTIKTFDGDDGTR